MINIVVVVVIIITAATARTNLVPRLNFGTCDVEHTPTHTHKLKAGFIGKKSTRMQGT